MGIKALLHYTSTDTNIQYGLKPTDRLDVDRLLAGKPAWKKPEGLGLKKKTLIVNTSDLNAIKEMGDMAGTTIIQERLEVLAQQGFDLYVFYNNELRPWSDIKKPKLGEPWGNSKGRIQIVDAVQVLGLSIDELLILDKEILAQLITGDDEDWAPYRQATEIELHQSNLSSRSLARLLDARQEEMTALSISECLNLSDTLDEDGLPPELSLRKLKKLTFKNSTALSKRPFGSINKRLPQELLCALINAAPTLCVLDLDGCSKDVLNYLTNPAALEELRLSRCELNPARLMIILSTMRQIKALNLLGQRSLNQIISGQLNTQALEELYLDDPLINDDTLRILLQNTQALKVLHLLDCQKIVSWDFFPHNLNSLETLVLKGSNITTKTLEALLGQAPNLKILRLSGCKHLEGDLTKAPNLGSLEEIYLSSSNITTKTLEALLGQAPNLKILELSQCTNLEGDLPKALNLHSLETLNLQRSNISINTLGALLGQAPKLKILHLSGCKHLEGDLTKAPNLGSLEEIYLSSSNITTKTLEVLLEKAPKLKILELSQCANLEGDLTKAPNLGSLEEIYLSSSNISINTLGALLGQAPKLKILDLSWCKHLEDDLTKAPNLGSLEEIYLGSSNIPLKTLEALLGQAPKLKILDLSWCKHLEGDLTKAPNLRSLETLNLQYSNISINTLGALLEQAPKLKILHLSECEYLEDDLTKVLNLGSLEEFYLSSSTITLKTLEALIGQAPNLKILELSQCVNLEGDLPKALNLGSLETLNLQYSNISINTLGALLEQAPKLKILRLSGCANLDKEDLERITRQYPHLKIDHIEIDHIEAGAEAVAVAVAGAEAEAEAGAEAGAGAEAEAGAGAGAGAEAEAEAEAGAEAEAEAEAEAGAGAGAGERRIDANTEFNPEASLPADIIFYSRDPANKPPHVDKYRLDTYNRLHITAQRCPIKDAFTLDNTDNLQLSSSSAQAQKTDTWTSSEQGLYGKQHLKRHTQWQALASISTTERLTAYHLSDEVAHELAYSRRDNLYYIRLIEPLPLRDKALTVDFILREPQPPSSSRPLPLDIQQKIADCRAFQAGALQGLEANATGGDYMNALEAQKVGACRHRAVVFMHWIQQNHPEIQVRFVNNAFHAFIELYHDAQWQRIDLGGYATDLKLSEPCPPPDRVLQSQQSQQSQHGSMRPSYFQMPQAEPAARSSMEYIQHLLAVGHKKILLDVKGTDIAPLRQVIQRVQGERPCWYIHAPEDLMTSAPFIQRMAQADGHYTGALHKGPGGAFYDFLKAHEHDAPLIIVNYATFSPADIVRFNALLDTIRQADGTALPEKAIVLGLSDLNATGAYDGADFLSRFNYRAKCPLHTEQLPSPIDIQQQGEHPADYVIDLLGQSNWEEQLLGTWSLSGQALTFVPGALIQALKSTPPKTHIELRNAPWGNKDFERFWQDTLSSGILRSRDDTLPLPKNFFITKSQGYDWASLTQKLVPASDPLITPAHQVLTPHTLSLFLGAYACDNETHTVTRSEGLLQQASGQTLPVYLNAPLSDAEWARLLSECATHRVTLSLHKAPDLPLPKDWGALCNRIPEPDLSEPKPWIDCTQNQDCIIQSSDKDMTRKQLNSSSVLEIDVSELDTEHLFTQIQASFDKEQLCFSFTQREGALLCALRENKTVVLHGTIKPALWDALNQLLIERQQRPALNQGVLMVLGTPPYPQPHIPLFKHQVGFAAQTAALSTEGLDAEDLDPQNNKPYTQLRAEAAHRKRASSRPGSSPWQGIHTLPPEPQKQGPLDLSIDAANAMNIQRMSVVSETLANAPFVLLSGKTGVGKSSFIPQWRQAHPAVHIGESALHAFATDTREGIKTLFIDEANISGSDWSLFEGLFNKNPGIVIDGIYYPLTKEHKVIFAANPMSYGGERRLPALFERHGNSVIFEPMIPAFLYHKVLAPLLNHQEEWAKPLLDMAEFFESCNPNAVLISPRELEMMALLAMNYCKRTPNANPLEVVKYYAYTLGKQLVPKEKSAQFEALFKTEELPQPPLGIQTLRLSKSNQAAYQALHDLLELRKARKEGSIPPRGGLGGLIIEGEPGVGKSALVIQTLLAQGLTRADTQKEHPDGKVFYLLPPSASYEEKEALLLKAFHEGAVVVIDEINSSHMMERLLNALLMGTTPQGAPAKNPGFLIIGTQNPISMAGRKQASNALQRRTQKIIIPEYTQDEMAAIIQSKGLDSARTEALIHDYLEAKKSQNLCFRDLIERAKDLISASAHRQSHRNAGSVLFANNAVEIVEIKEIDHNDDSHLTA